MEFDLHSFGGLCACGAVHSVVTRGCWVEEGALSRLPALLGKHGFAAPAVLCDENTRFAAQQACALLPEASLICLPPRGLHANEHGVALAEQALPAGADVLVAVGSGTIHDITRYVAHARGVPFFSVPTAASVDGFVSTVAAMTWNGCKKTFPAVAPLYVLADSAIFAAAPLRLSASGVADLLGKYTAIADWRIAGLATGETVCERVCALELEALERVRANLGGIRAGEKAACEQLMYGLLLSGIAMQMVGNSRPASGAEHHLSHLWEMAVLAPETDAYHGEKVGVGLLCAARAYHAFAQALREGRVEATQYGGLEHALLESTFGAKGQLEGILEENTPDPLLAVDAGALLAQKDALLRILADVPQENELDGVLAAVGAMRTMGEAGVPEALRGESLRLSPYVRARLTLMRMMKLYRVLG